MSKLVKIPTSMSPFVVIVNGKEHKYPAGETVEVPDNIAAIIEQYEKGSFPKSQATATVIKMISPGGKCFAVTVSDTGELVSTKVSRDVISFSIEGSPQNALEGMTWGEWAVSEYAPVAVCPVCGKEYSKYKIDGDGNVDEMATVHEQELGCVLEAVVSVAEYETREAAENKDIDHCALVKASDVIDPNKIYGWDG